MKVSLQLWQEALKPAGSGHEDNTGVAYSEEALYGAGMEAGIAAQKVETIFMQESFRLEREASQTDIELIAQGMFDKGGFFNNIWKAIADAFKRVADFVGQLFGKITGATEKNLKTVKDQMVLLQANAKYTGLTTGTGKAQLKEGSYIKVPKTSVIGPLMTAIMEINDVAAGDNTSSLALLAYNRKTLMSFYNDTLDKFAAELAERKEAGTYVTQVTTFMDEVRKSQTGGNDPLSNADKAVKKQIASFISDIAILIAEAKTGEGESAGALAKLNTIPIAKEGGDLASVFRVPADIKSIAKPEDKADIKSFILDTYKASSDEKRVEGTAIIEFLNALGATYDATLANPDTYINLEKFFKDGKDKFTTLSQKYEDIAKDFESAVNSAAGDNTQDAKDANSAANQIKYMVGSTGDVTKLTSFFTQLSLKWYSTIDGLLTLGLANMLNLIKVALNGLESNTVEVVVTNK